MVEDLFRRADLGDDAGVQDDDAVRHDHRLLAVVRDVDRGDAETPLQGGDLVPHGQPDAGVEVGERLVEKQDVRLDRQRTAERDALALAAGQVRGPALAEAVETEQRLDLADALGRSRRAAGPCSFRP